MDLQSPMAGTDRILLIPRTDHDPAFPLVLSRPDGTAVVPRTVGPEAWVSAIRSQDFDLVLAPPELLHEHAFERGQREVLELIAAGAPLTTQLEQIVLLIEAQAPGMICSILLLDREQGKLYTGAAPHLPAPFVEAINGAKIGPCEGSCGSAAYRVERVIVEDIATHDYWANYKDFALPHGLRACWSTPILSADGDVLGTFAMYFAAPRSPGPQELHWVDRASHIASISIQRGFNEAKLSVQSLVLQRVSDVIFYLAVEANEQYRFLSVNPAFTVATGLPYERVVGHTIDEVLPASSLPAVRAHYAQAIAEERAVGWLEVSHYPSGTRYEEVSVKPILSADGVSTHLIGTIHDVTERHLAQERIEAQAAMLDRAHDAIVVWDVDGTIRYWNEGARRLYGWTRADAVGGRVERFVMQNQEEFARVQQALMNSGSWRGELAQQTRAGKPLVIEASWTLLRDDDGAPKSVLAINTDVTERRRLELQIFRSQRLESLGTLVGGIAHDFNNILTAIIGNAGLAQGQANSEGTRDALAQIEKASERGAELVRQMLTFSRQQEPRRVAVALQQIVTETLSLLRASLPKTIKIQTEFAADLPRIFADTTQVHQVVVNLVTNAAHAMAGRGGVLGVRVDGVTFDTEAARRLGLGAGTYARLIVSDTGVGMNETTLERIFDPFFTTKDPGRGTGLGLAVVHGIVKSHEGVIVVRSTPGGGSEFEVYFPALAAGEK
jgi:PAS domain S-box-containing protein